MEDIKLPKIVEDYIEKYGGVTVTGDYERTQLLLERDMIQTEKLPVEWLLGFYHHYENVVVSIPKPPDDKYGLIITLYKKTSK